MYFADAPSKYWAIYQIPHRTVTAMTAPNAAIRFLLLRWDMIKLPWNRNLRGVDCGPQLSGEG